MLIEALSNQMAVSREVSAGYRRIVVILLLWKREKQRTLVKSRDKEWPGFCMEAKVDEIVVNFKR